MEEDKIVPHVEVSHEVDKRLIDNEIHLLRQELSNIREEMRGNPYVIEAQKVIQVKGYRSAIGSYWNAVVDDLRKKIIHRSLDLFNKEIQPRKEIKSYDDFQDYVIDHELIEGAYKIGVIGWEAKKILQQAREVRNIFDGHPNSTEPHLLKVLNFISDCNKYVLSQEYPVPIIDINVYFKKLEKITYDRNEISVEQALGDLPSVYKTELINRLLNTYINEDSSTILRANIEFCSPILWKFLPEEDKKQIGRRLDQLYIEGDKEKITYAVEFLIKLDGLKYASNTTRKAILEPIIKELEENLDNWSKEGELVYQLERLGAIIPEELLFRYVQALTLTYVGHRGYSLSFSRKNFFSDAAAPVIRRIFQEFDDRAAQNFVETIKTNSTLKTRIGGSGQLARLRRLAQILLSRSGLRKDVEGFLNFLMDKEKEKEFIRSIR
jgi:hypothetical protein